MTDIDYMKTAFRLALRAKGKTSPNPLVGALIVRGHRIVAEGWHKYCGADHAEVMALKKAGRKAQGATLYVTLEPCSYFGRTPPCVDPIIAAGIREVVVGMKDPNPLNNGKSLVMLRRAGIKMRVGFLEEPLKEMNEAFIKYITKKLPFVVAKCAQTLDGKIATASGRSQWITSPASRDYAHALRKDFDAILVGINTVLKDDPFLNAPGKRKPIKKIVVDTHLQIPMNANVFKDTEPSSVMIAATAKAKKTKIQLLRKKGVCVLMGPESHGGVQLKWLLRELAKREIANLLMEGGGRTIGGALREDLVDKFLIFMAPKIMGDERALGSVSGLMVRHVDESVRLYDVRVERLGEDILIEGYVHRNR